MFGMDRMSFVKKIEKGEEGEGELMWFLSFWQ